MPLGAERKSYLDARQERRERTVLHFVWWEERPTGGDVLYTPVVLLDGVYAGHPPPSSLPELLGLDPSSNPGGILPPGAAELTRKPAVRKARRQGEVPVAFGREESGRILTSRLTVPPVGLTGLAEDLRAHMIEIGHELDGPRGVGRLGEKLRAHMIEIGLSLQQDGTSAIRAKSRQAATRVVELDSLDGPDGPVASPKSLARFVALRPVASFEFPETAGGEKELLISDNGREIMVTWALDDEVVDYRETLGEAGWSEPHRLHLDETMNAERVREVLERRMTQR